MVLLLLFLNDCYAHTNLPLPASTQQRHDGFFGKTNSSEKNYHSTIFQ